MKAGELKGPIAFSRDHLDAGAMAHPNIMTEHMKDGSDAIADWPLINAMTLCASMADLVVIHSGGGGYAGYMTSAGVTIVADGTEAADERIATAINNDTSLGIVRYADAVITRRSTPPPAMACRIFPLGRQACHKWRLHRWRHHSKQVG